MTNIDQERMSVWAAGAGQTLQGPREEDLFAFTQELASGNIKRWRHGESCDSVVANGSIGWILSGSVRKFLTLRNGHRRIIDLIMPGDFFGMRVDATQRFSYEASTNGAMTAKITRGEFNALAETRPRFFRIFHERACQTIGRLEEHILVQGCTSSTHKIAGYLLLMSRRLSENQGAAVSLPMSRYDIADHLGIAVETVSRGITELRRQGVIELQTPRCVAIRNAEKLAEAVPEFP